MNVSLPTRDSTLPELLGELTGQLVTLGKQEIELAKAELTESAKKSARDSVGLLAGGVILQAALFSLVGALVAGLALYMPIWVSFVVVAAALTLVGGLTLRIALSKFSRDTKLERLPRSLHANKEFLKEKIA